MRFIWTGSETWFRTSIIFGWKIPTEYHDWYWWRPVCVADMACLRLFGVRFGCFRDPHSYINFADGCWRRNVWVKFCHLHPKMITNFKLPTVGDQHHDVTYINFADPHSRYVSMVVILSQTPKVVNILKSYRVNNICRSSRS